MCEHGFVAAGDTTDDSTYTKTPLEELGLTPGEKVRWQRKAGGHWHLGVVVRREPDGSVAVNDADGAWRSIPVERLEARCGMRRGRILWEPLTDRLERPDQLSLWR